MKKTILFLAILLTFSSSKAWADILQETFDDLNCPLTPQLIDLKPHPEVANTNNLRRFPGHPDVASGDLIVIKGQVMDSHCVPIPDAVVEIWQADSIGKELLDIDFELNQEYDPHFIGSGKAITDNMGNYYFFTVMPGNIDENHAPSVNFLIKHRDFLPFETKMYFENQSLNHKDKLLNKYVNKAKQKYLVAQTSHDLDTSTEDLAYNFNITLEGVNRYLRY